MRINRYLAKQGLATRRGADALIARGLVHLNDRVAVLGDQVTEGDRVELIAKAPKKQYAYYAYHKPRGVITHSPQQGEKEVKEMVPLGVFPIGRLDKDSSGLLILTDDGRVTDRLLNPEYTHEKEYRVRTVDNLRESFASYLERGVDIDGYVTKPAQVRKTGPRSFSIVLTEGKKHQIRRMVAALHNSVESLERVRVLNIRLDDLAPGAYRPIEGEELQAFLSGIGLK